ncbi:helix-turn-helix transcriptional regulator [Chitinophaga sp. Mgbs1]|uniref:Helix-turn-helix transcriptional regulator n=1 Tax=Chitinophaga solisilvae TaxID=1233460 RepID=A0A433WH02_9BACT|nr:helix-turn-helix transcriptional regulator [Chitinophaga solisilvae]
MQDNSISTFYQQYLDQRPEEKNNFLGYFDVFSWNQLKEDLSACDRLQRKPFYKIALLSGDAVYYSNEEQIRVSGKTIVFINPMTQSRFKTADIHFTGEYCVFSDDFLRGSGKMATGSWPVFQGHDMYVQPLTTENYDALRKIFRELETEYAASYQFKEELIRNRVLDIIHFTQKLETSPAAGRPAQHDPLTTLFFNHLEQAFSHISPRHPLAYKTPAQFAQLLSTPVDRLNKTLRKSTGKTTIALLHGRLLQEANVLLRHTSWSIKEIAWCLSFRETAHFQNFYRKHAGCTPHEYRTA